jgi:hypothetical protein
MDVIPNDVIGREQRIEFEHSFAEPKIPSQAGTFSPAARLG